ncbi:hypothetical protein [Nostoc piscinale]|nr:hypothetical protein [Nostoc piscinale]
MAIAWEYGILEGKFAFCSRELVDGEYITLQGSGKTPKEAFTNKTTT